MTAFQYPLLTYSQKGLLKYARSSDDLLKTNSYLLKKGDFRGLIIIDSAGRKYRVLDAKKNKPYGLFWGISPFLYQNIIVDLILEKEYQQLTLEPFKREFAKMYKKDAYLIGGYSGKEGLKFITASSSIEEIISYYCESFFKEYTV